VNNPIPTLVEFAGVLRTFHQRIKKEADLIEGSGSQSVSLVQVARTLLLQTLAGSPYRLGIAERVKQGVTRFLDRAASLSQVLRARRSVPLLVGMLRFVQGARI
jgi:hypothetical protein